MKNWDKEQFSKNKKSWDKFLCPQNGTILINWDIIMVTLHSKGAPEVLGSLDSRRQIFEHALLAKPDGFG